MDPDPGCRPPRRQERDRRPSKPRAGPPHCPKIGQVSCQSPPTDPEPAAGERTNAPALLRPDQPTRKATGLGGKIFSDGIDSSDDGRPLELEIGRLSSQRPATDPEPAAGERTNTTALLPAHRRTRKAVWCGAALCFVFGLLLIVVGVITLVVFLVIRPRLPQFDAPGATLNSIYVDSPQSLNGDFTFLANFSNPNRKIDVRFEYVSMELYFDNTLVASQALQPFSQRRGEARLVSVHMVSSEVSLSPELVKELQKEVGSNGVVYNIRGTFKVRASLGAIHFTYWLYGRCTLVLTRPPTGILLARRCRTRR